MTKILSHEMNQSFAILFFFTVFSIEKSQSRVEWIRMKWIQPARFFLPLIFTVSLFFFLWQFNQWRKTSQFNRNPVSLSNFTLVTTFLFLSIFFTFSNSSPPEDWIKNILPCHILSLTFFLHLYFFLTRFFLIPLLPSSFVTLLFFEYFVLIVVFFLPPFSRMFNCTYCPILAHVFSFLLFYGCSLFHFFDLASFLLPSTLNLSINFFLQLHILFSPTFSLSLSGFFLFPFFMKDTLPKTKTLSWTSLHPSHSLTHSSHLSSFLSHSMVSFLPLFHTFFPSISLFLRRQSSSSYSSLSFHFPIPFFMIETISRKNILSQGKRKGERRKEGERKNERKGRKKGTRSLSPSYLRNKRQKRMNWKEGREGRWKDFHSLPVLIPSVSF